MLGKLTLKYVTPTLSKLSQSRLKAPEIQHLDEMFSEQRTSTVLNIINFANTLKVLKFNLNKDELLEI